MTTVTDPEWRKLLGRPDIAGFAKTLAEVEPGYYSNPELAYRVAGSERIDRTIFYKLIDALVESGKLRSLNVWHNSTSLRVLHIEFDRLRELFAGIE